MEDSSHHDILKGCIGLLIHSFSLNLAILYPDIRFIS